MRRLLFPLGLVLLAVLLWHQRAWYDKKYPGWKLVYHRAVEHLHDEDLAWVATAGQVAGRLRQPNGWR